ncbi:T9SS sorting signal type C domain-containing protein [Flavobacterium saccharophilum]|uniref:PA14 domain-containing protein n=1 Tax=Flavobacterium saccharophilum TaxID=29534 RepID=A0A1M6ZHM2_9FLAO|nr:T9SS sorting signal type C domain-containing protein [Flavobacterium saccharophilum]SHL29849.1 PA14 domain-containing protein [Flavobacterium saccharophilum]
MPRFNMIRKLLLPFLFLLLPFFGFAQTIDLATWSLTSNGDSTFKQNYVQNASFTSDAGQNPITYGSTGALVTGWNNSDYVHYRYVEISIVPTTNNVIWISNLILQQSSIPNGGLSNYIAKYAITQNGTTPDASTFYNTATPLVAEESISGNPYKTIKINESLNSTQKLIVRFYTKGNDFNAIKWQFLPNTLKFTGKLMGPLAGPYIIGNSTVSDFTSIKSAINALNNVGVSAPVTFLIDENQTIASQLTINQFTGTSATNTVTIRPNDNKNVSIIGSIRNGALIALNGADNVIIDGNNAFTDNNLKLFNNYSNGANDNRLGIWLYNDANNNTFKNLYIQMTILGKTIDVFATGIFSGGNTIGSSGNNSNNTVSNITFTETKQPIFIEGGNNWIISKNKLGSDNTDIQPSVGIYINNVNGYTVSGNTISGITKFSNDNIRTAAGISILGSSTAGTIYNNIINNVNNTHQSNQSNTAGIFIDNSATSTTTIYNNIISNVYTQANDNGDSNINYKGHGIYIKNGINKLYYNTIAMIPSNQNNGRSSCVYIEGATSVDLKNNILYNSRTSGTQYALYSKIANANLTSNYNSFYVTSGNTDNVVRNQDNSYKLSDWMKIKDANSVVTAPAFTSTYRLNTTDAANNILKGDPITDIITDIDGTIRVKPYMGAYEIKTCTPVGNEIAFGNDSWIGYVYKWTGTNAPDPKPTALPGNDTTVYIGTVTESSQVFDRNVGNNAITGTTINICGPAPLDKFLVRYKMKTTTAAGIYNFSIGGDDGARLYIDGKLVISRWNDHSFIIDGALIELTADSHEFIFEYYENGGAARATFSYGLIKGDNLNLPYGINVWNVYGFTQNNFNLSQTVYAGTYVDSNVNITTTGSWPKEKSPSANTEWQGAPMPIDNFTTTHRRQGFPCGNYKIQLVNYDDDVQIYVNGVLKFPLTTNKTAPQYINNGEVFVLNSSSKVEVLLKENGGDAYMGIKFESTPVIYDGTGTPPANTTAITIASNTTLQTDLEVCSCTINPGITLTVPSNKTLTVNENITVGAGGKLLLENNASLLQTSVAADAYTGDFDSFVMQRNTSPVRRYDFTCWSTPVNRPSGFTLHDVSPLTLADKYYSFNPSTGWKISYSGVLPMEPGMGYIVRAPQTYDINTAAVYPATFTGKPNNGTIQITPEANKNILVGNPYPSALNAKKFIDDNSIAGVDVGSLYFWTHNSPPVNSIPGDKKYYYNTADYAVFNLTGSTKGSNTPGYNAKPTGYIAAAESFFIRPNSGNKISFTNGMRVVGKNDQFFKTEKTTTEENNRLWLNFSNTEGAFKQALIGYIDGATDNLDYNYDAPTNSGNAYVDFYSINNTDKLTIQGRALPFNDTDLVPLGYVSKIVGDFTISIEEADGFFDTQAVYLEDKTTGKTVDLRAADYTFATEKGTFEDRFVLRYTNKTLGTGDFENIENGLLVSVKDKVIKVTSAEENIKEVTIFDINGKQLQSKNKIGSTELLISALQAANQVLLVKVTLENEFVVTKKIVFQ